ncbi:MAG: hypothetical protein IMZ58_02030 [Thermoplasmata archaeon]|nr:hypothetical protein [Thermoplasmata archaeon]
MTEETLSKVFHPSFKMIISLLDMVSFSEGLVFALKTYSLENPAVPRTPIDENEQRILTSIKNKFQEVEHNKGHPAN